jgi:hypothetical protein
MLFAIGWLMKQPRRRFKLSNSWTLRYVVLLDGVLMFFEDYDEEEDEPKNKRGSMVRVLHHNLHALLRIYNHEHINPPWNVFIILIDVRFFRMQQLKLHRPKKRYTLSVDLRKKISFFN